MGLSHPIQCSTTLKEKRQALIQKTKGHLTGKKLAVASYVQRRKDTLRMGWVALDYKGVHSRTEPAPTGPSLEKLKPTQYINNPHLRERKIK